MSLDANLFTLNFAQNKDDPNVIDLVDPSDNSHYRKQRVPGTEYRINLYEPLSESLLASVAAPSATSKIKLIELHNPSHKVELKYTGTLSFKWRFEWEEHEFEWRREECYIIRKPDPAVMVAVTKEPSGRIRTSSVQILDYNLNRFDIDDRKGLEIVLLTALLTFQDTNEAYHTPTSPSPPAPTDGSPSRPGFFGMSRRVSDSVIVNNSAGTAPLSTPPALPPKPAAKGGVDKIAETQAVRVARGEGEANEIEVGEDGTVEEYAQHTERMLRDDAMLFVTIRSASAMYVPKVLQVVEHTKRLRHKAGLDEDQELFQYVIYETAKKGPKRINLDDNAPSHVSYSPPTSLVVHLSKIDMPELRPRLENLRTGPSMRARPALMESPITQPEEEKRKKKEKKERGKVSEKETKKGEKADRHRTAVPECPQPNRLTKPTATSTSLITPASSSDKPPSSQLRRPLSFHAPPNRPGPPYHPPLHASNDLSFPQPQSNASSFYSGMTYPSDPSTIHSTSFMSAPPRHPSTSQRPQSFYGSNPFVSTPYKTYGPGYLGP